MKNTAEVMKTCCQEFSDIVAENYSDVFIDEIQKLTCSDCGDGYRIIIYNPAEFTASSKALYNGLESICINQFCEEKGIKELDYNNDNLMDEYCVYETEFFYDGLSRANILLEVYFCEADYYVHIETSVGDYGQYIPFEKDMKFSKGNERAMLKKIKEIAEEI